MLHSDPGGRVKLMGGTLFYILLPTIDGEGNIEGFTQEMSDEGGPIAITMSNALEVADINGDGLQDIIVPHESQLSNVFGSGRIDIIFSRITEDNDGSVVEFTTKSVADFFPARQDSHYSPIKLIDFNGDGIVDIESCPINNFSIPCRRALLNVNQGAGVVSNVTAIYESSLNPTRKTKILGTGEDAQEFSSPKYYQDLNGDGLVDLLWVASDGIYSKINNGVSYNSAYKIIDSLPDDSFSLQFFDYNSDGLLDIAFATSGALKKFIAKHDFSVNSTGPRFSYTQGLLGGVITSKIFRGIGYRFLKSVKSLSRDVGAGERLYSLFHKRSILPLDAPTTFDYNHDGMQDLIFFKENDTTLYATSLTTASLRVDKLSSVTDTFGNTTSFTYKTTKQEPVDKFYETRFPYKNIANTAMVVDTMSFNSDALPAPITTSYEYTGALYHMQGRGYLGFEKRTVTDENRGLITKEVYEQAYPLTGRLKSIKTYHKDAPSNLINKTENTWASKSLGFYNDQIKIPYLAQSKQYQYALPGVLTSIDTGINTFDDFANLLTRTQTVADSNGTQLTQTLTAKYKHINASGNYIQTEMNRWRIGFRTSLTHTSSAAGYTQNRTTTWVPYSGTNRVAQYTQNVGGDQEMTTALSYTATGKLASKNISSGGTAQHAVAARTELTNSNFYQGYLPQTITNATGHQATIEYHPEWHQPVKQTNVQGLTTLFNYDNSGALLSTTSADGSIHVSTTQYCANISGCPSSAFYRSTVMQMHAAQKGFLAPPQYTYYDKLGRVIREETLNASGAQVYQDYSYDAQSRLNTSSLPYLIGQSPIFTRYNNYDLYDRPQSIAYDNGNQGSVSYAYGISNNQFVTTRIVTNVIPGASNQIQVDSTRYDALGQIAHIKNNESGLENTYHYDGQGNIRRVLVKRSGATLKTVTATFNNAGLKTQINDPDTGIYNYEYDALGLMRKQSDARGNEYTFNYNTLNNQTNSMLNGQEDGTWVYSEAQPGLLKERYKNGFKESYQYDSLLRMTQVDTNLKTLATRQFKYAYDKAGRLDTAHYPSGFSVQAQYNALGYLSAYNNPKNNHSYWQAEGMDAFGNWVGERFGNNVQTIKSYDPASGLLNTIKSSKSTSNLGEVQNLAYIWDSNGNLRSRADNNISVIESFNYDAVSRLKTATTTGLASGTRTLNYAYDDLGNLKFKSDLVSGSAYSANNKLVYGNAASGPSRLQSVIKDGNTVLSYDYDNSGNMIQRGNTNLSYTAANKPNHIWKTVNSDRLDTYFDYDTSEQRYYQASEKNFETKQEIYYYGAGYEEIFDTDSQTGIKTHKQKAYVGGIMIHTYTQTTDANLIADGQVGKFADIQYLHHDHLGSTQSITDATGSIVQTLAFDPFGKARQSNWEDLNSANPPTEGNPNWASIALNNTSSGFTGHEILADFDLIHMGGRIYDPTVGRMMSADPYIQAPYFGQSFNRYSYVWNNPMSMTDPSGYVTTTTTNTNIAIELEVSKCSMLDECTGIKDINGTYSIAETSITSTQTPYSNGYINGSGLESDYAQNGGTSAGGATGVINTGGSYTDASGSTHVSAGFSIASISSGNNTPVRPIEIMSALDSVQLAADLLAVSEIPILSQVAGAANALTYAVRGNWSMAGSSILGLVPGFGAAADAGRLGMWAAKGMGKVKSSLKTIGKTCCFVAGTLVLTSNGHANIEDLEIGDKVLAQNTATGEVASKEITQTFTEKNRPIYEIKVVNGNGQITIMETTDDHPFYVLRDKQNPYIKTDASHGQQSLQTTKDELGNWKLSKDLIKGDRVRTYIVGEQEGASVKGAVNNEVTVLSSVFTGTYDVTFNLTVADFNTYFVTDQNVLVHNCNVTKKANPLDGTTFTDKVKRQMNGKDTDHNFPSLVDKKADTASVKKITGGDGVERTKVELPGSINGKDGNFSWIIEPDKTINHRQFERLKKK